MPTERCKAIRRAEGILRDVVRVPDKTNARLDKWWLRDIAAVVDRGRIGVREGRRDDALLRMKQP